MNLARVSLPIAVIAICLGVYGEALFGVRPGVISSGSGDVAGQFIYWRQFAADSLRQGHVPQWNPYVYCGTPFMGAWQSALFYPPNWTYLVLPLDFALNLDPVISTVLAGLFMALLARKQGFRPIACLLTASIVMLGGPFFSHVWAGHLTELAAMAWTPLVLLATELIVEDPTPKGVLLGAAGLALQILAGHPQTVFNTLLLAAVYGAFRAVRKERRWGVPAAFIGAVALGCGLAAVQLFTGIATSQESARSGGVGIAFAGLFSFAPENLPTLAVPHLFGDSMHMPYFGRWVMWEESAFAGVGSLVLAAIGLSWRKFGRETVWAIVGVLMILLSLGKYSPLFGVLYRSVPGFPLLRAHGRFVYEAIVMLALIAGSGLSALIGDARDTTRAGWATIGAAGAVLIAAAFLGSAAGRGVIPDLWRRGDLAFNPSTMDVTAVLQRGPSYMALQVAAAAALFAAVGVLLLLRRRFPFCTPVLAAVAIAELIVYAASTVTTFDPRDASPPAMTRWFQANPGDYRIMQQAFGANSVMAFRQYDVWGYDPALLRRYADLMTLSDSSSGKALMNVPSPDAAPLLRMLRCAYVFSDDNGRIVVRQVAHPLPHALLVDRVMVEPRRVDAFRTLLSPNFDASREVVLESGPALARTNGGDPGTAAAAWKDSDTIEVTANASEPAILLITDAYSRFWSATALPGSVQSSYRIEPGDYALIAIPVRAGRHHFELKYRPAAFAIGGYVSVLSLAVFAALAVFGRRRTIEGNR